MNLPQQSFSYSAVQMGSVAIDAAAWVGEDEEIQLGCECANPALQIERWGQEATGALPLGV